MPSKSFVARNSTHGTEWSLPQKWSVLGDCLFEIVKSTQRQIVNKSFISGSAVALTFTWILWSTPLISPCVRAEVSPVPFISLISSHTNETVSVPEITKLCTCSPCCLFSSSVSGKLPTSIHDPASTTKAFSMECLLITKNPRILRHNPRFSTGFDQGIPWNTIWPVGRCNVRENRQSIFDTAPSEFKGTYEMLLIFTIFPWTSHGISDPISSMVTQS